MIQLRGLLSLKDSFSAPLKKSMSTIRMFESSTTSLNSSMSAVTRTFTGVPSVSNNVSKSFTAVSVASKSLSDGLASIDATQALDGADMRYDSLGRRIRTVFKGASAEAQRMSAEMRSAFATQRVAMSDLRDDMIGVEYGYFKLANSSSSYVGTTKSFISEVESIGKRHKSVTDQMVANNEMAKVGFIASIGSMLARSTQASKISENLSSMGNPLYLLNKPLLSVADGLNKIAMRGTPAALALKMLGPTANMKQLGDMTRMISQGLMRFTAVALIAGVAALAFYSKLHKAAMEANKGYADSFKAMTESISKTFDPLIQTFAKIMTPVFNVVTKIGEMVTKFQEAHPMVAKLASAFMILVPALTVILSPLAVGIGLVSGLGAALAAAAPLMMPVVTGFAAVLGTTIAVAAGITLLGAGLYLLYTRSETFRAGVTAAWSAIKTAAMSVFNFLAPYVTQALTAVTAFVQAKLTVLQQFWSQNGAQIIQALTNVWTAITSVVRAGMAILTPIFMVGFALVKTIVVGAWSAIKNIITGALNIIMGAVKVFTGLFTGNFSTMWSGIKQIFSGAIQAIYGYINLVFVGRILKAGAALFTGLKASVSAGWSSIKSFFSSNLAAIKSSVSTAFNAIKGFFSGGFNAAKVTVSAGWTNIKSYFTNGISSAKNSVSTGFQNIVNTISTKITSAKTAIMDWAKSLPGNLLSAFRSAMGQLSSIGSLVWDQIKGSLPSIGSIKDYVTGAVTGSGGSKKAGAKSDGRHYSGLFNVPKHGYQATLHSGESVLTASQSALLRNNGVLTRRNGNLADVNPNAGANTSRPGAGAPVASPNVTLHVENVVIREEADITKVATRLAKMLRQSDDRSR